MDSSTLLYQKFTSRFVFIFFIFILSVTFIISLLVLREQQLNSIIEQKLPDAQRVYQQQVIYLNIKQLIASIEQSEQLIDVNDIHQHLITLLNQLKTLTVKDKRIIENLISEIATQTDKLSRLVQNDNRIDLLTKNSRLQLQLVLDELTLKESELSKELADQQQLSKSKTFTLPTLKNKNHVRK